MKVPETTQSTRIPSDVDLEGRREAGMREARADPTEEAVAALRAALVAVYSALEKPTLPSGQRLLPIASNEAEVAISADIDAILTRLEEGTPRLFEDMKEIQSSLRRPLAV